MSAQVKLANRVYTVYSVRRADRGPTPITRLIHLLPPAVPLQGPDSRSYTILIARHVNLLSRSAARAATGHRRPAQSWSAAPVAIIALGDVELRRSTRPAPRPRRPRWNHPRVPPTDTERPPPCQIQAGSRRAACDQGSLETLLSAPCRPD